jgi:pimeloyl-ACP methyl ester carboxylesterase
MHSLIQGLDWHGPSAQDAWASVDALVTIIDNHTSWHPWSLVKSTPVILIGHSNGGQGAWHMAARHPDRVLAGE